LKQLSNYWVGNGRRCGHLGGGTIRKILIMDDEVLASAERGANLIRSAAKIDDELAQRAKIRSAGVRTER